MGSDSLGGTSPLRCPSWTIFRESGFLDFLGYTFCNFGAFFSPFLGGLKLGLSIAIRSCDKAVTGHSFFSVSYLSLEINPIRANNW